MLVLALVYSVLGPRYWFSFKELRRVFDSPRLYQKYNNINVLYCFLLVLQRLHPSRFLLVDGIKLGSE